MRLAELEPTFLKYISPDRFQEVGDVMVGADGVMFTCPKCRLTDGHSIICWSPSVPLPFHSPGRWEMRGTGFHDLTLYAAPLSSVKLLSGCLWHGNVVNGEVTDC